MLVEEESREESREGEHPWATEYRAEANKEAAHILRAAEGEEEHVSWTTVRDQLAKARTLTLEGQFCRDLASLSTLAEAGRREGAEGAVEWHSPREIALFLSLYCREFVTRKEKAEESRSRKNKELADLRKKIEAADSELVALRKEIGSLRDLVKKAQACEPSPSAAKRSIGVQTPTPRREVGEGAGGWSVDRVRALIDERMGVLCDNIVAEVCGGAGGRPPARKKNRPPPPGAAGPAPSPQGEEQWSRVLGRRERREAKEEVRTAPRPSRPGRGASWGGAIGARKEAGRKPRLPKPPGTAAVVLAPVRGEQEVDVEGVVDLAMGDEALAGCGALDIRARRTVTGGLLLQIPGGEDSAAKADKLAAGIRGVLAKQGVTGVRVDRPVKLADVRVTGLVGPATPEKVARALAGSGGCGAGEVRVGAIRRAPLGSGSAWVRLPVAAARRVVAAGVVKVGWLSVGVVPIDSRPMRCYRCLCVGHSGQRCTAQEDRGVSDAGNPATSPGRALRRS